MHIVLRGDGRACGVQPGVAVQFREPPAGIRGRLGAAVRRGRPRSRRRRRAHARSAARRASRCASPARLESRDAASIRGRTRNLSQSGVLIDVQEGSGGGRRARARRRSGTRPSGEGLAIDGAFVRDRRRARAASRRVAVHFDADEARRAAVERLRRRRCSEPSTRAGSARSSGPIAELGPESIVQMFANTGAAAATIVPAPRRRKRALISFESGAAARGAPIGPVTGHEGADPHAVLAGGRRSSSTPGVDEPAAAIAPLPLEAALFEAARKHRRDGQRVDAAAFPLAGRACVARHIATEGQFTGVLSKLEEALLDVAQAGLHRAARLEVIPEPRSGDLPRAALADRRGDARAHREPARRRWRHG